MPKAYTSKELIDYKLAVTQWESKQRARVQSDRWECKRLNRLDRAERFRGDKKNSHCFQQEL